MKWRSLEESTPETDIRPLREIFAERKELIAKYVPAETQAIHARAVSELKQQRLAANTLSVGARLPEFQLQDHAGKSVSSTDLLAQGRLVLCFIRGRWCPFCVGQMEAMNLLLPEIEQAGRPSLPYLRRLFSNLSSCATSTSCASRCSPTPGTKSLVSSD
jgi:AhpC/TSA family